MFLPAFGTLNRLPDGTNSNSYCSGCETYLHLSVFLYVEHCQLHCIVVFVTCQSPSPYFDNFEELVFAPCTQVAVQSCYVK